MVKAGESHDIRTQTVGWFDQELAMGLSTDISLRLQDSFGQHNGPRATLRLSKMGPQCPCALWNSVHHPELAEALPPWAKIKFAYGHVLEALVLCLARAAGHSVEGEQDEIILDGIVGHRDCVLDGCIVDVKSCSSRMFQKFKDKTIQNDDPFGYLFQLDGYCVGSADDPLVTVKDKAYNLCIDKTLGHLCLYEHTIRETLIRERIRDHKAIVSLNRPPTCTCQTVPYGAAGNIALGMRASYSEFKFECFPQLRTFLYSSGPVYLIKVVRKPDVPEVDRWGKIIYS